MALVKYNNNSLSAITATAGMPAGAMTLIKEQTASTSSTISLVNGSSDVVLDSTYPIYLFKWISVHPSANDVAYAFNGSIDAIQFKMNRGNMDAGTFKLYGIKDS